MRPVRFRLSTLVLLIVIFVQFAGLCAQWYHGKVLNTRLQVLEEENKVAQLALVRQERASQEELNRRRSQVADSYEHGQRPSRSEPAHKSGSPAHVLVLTWLGGSLDAGIRIRDKQRIKELIEEPLQNARRDPSPARYVALGTITVRMDDGSENTTLLFLPWGQIKRGNDYLVADLDKLHKYFDETMIAAAAELR
jgi:hypothetical protein